MTTRSQVGGTRQTTPTHTVTFIRTRLIARRVWVVSAVWPSVISSGGSSTRAHSDTYCRATGYGMAMDMMMMDVADSGTANPNTGTANSPDPTSGTGKSVGRDSRDTCDADEDGCSKQNDRSRRHDSSLPLF